MLHSAGIEAGHVTGDFFHAGKTDAQGNAWSNDMQCRVVTRDMHGLRDKKLVSEPMLLGAGAPEQAACRIRLTQPLH